MEPDEKKINMRQLWFEHVRKTRVKLTKKTKTNVSHRDAMKAASDNWAVEKEKIQRRLKREAKKKRPKKTRKEI